MEDDHKKAFLMYCDYKQHLELLSNEECGKLFLSILEYAESKKAPKLSGMAAMAFSFIKAQMDRDNIKYEERCVINRENGAKGGRPRKAANENQNKPKITERFSEKPKKADTDTDNDTDTEIDNGNDTDSDTDTDKEGSASHRGRDKSCQTSDTRFEEFWKAYPKKVGKAACMKAWKKLNMPLPLFQQILLSVDRQKQSPQWQREGGRFIPNPLTWLTQGRWDDEFTSSDEAQQPSRNKSFAGTMGTLAEIINKEESVCEVKFDEL